MTPDWIALDVGAAHLRGWAMRGRDELDMRTSSGEAMSPRGIVTFVEPWLGAAETPVIACGPLGPLGASVPARPLSSGTVRIDLGDARVAFLAVPGLRSAAPAGVMQGGETRIAGFLKRNPNWDGVLCLTGPETQWVHVSADEVVSFQTALSGGLVSALASATALARWMGQGRPDAESFAEAVEDAMAKPERLMARLAEAQAGAILEDQPPEVVSARVHGAVIGAELAAARPYWLGQQVAVIGDGYLPGLYRAALERQGVPVALADAAHMTLAGLIAARDA
ncbi:2-dehydro-3-deoxygalactonokinase [Lutimaribacter marinistellae]|uniref:2-dehydro-3-deoxygalactonokinase n=1 Tax=Lutimaribacter marinistellae TaxID=1820329 RepID=A0ABV7TGJ4_9RHOB